MFIVHFQANGQEIILSQPFSVSQYQNAAAAGSGSFNSRLQANYRNPIIEGEAGLFQTKTISFDSRLTKDWEPSLNYFGYGFVFVNDNVMNGVMQNNYLTLNLAYHIFFDDELTNHLAGGIGVTYANTSLDMSRLRFGDQYDYKDIISYTSTLENIAAYPKSLSFNGALMFTHHSSKKFIQSGAMVYKYDKPNVTYSPINRASELSYRAFLNTDISFSETDDGDDGNSVLLNFNYLNSGSKNQLNIGGLMGLKIKKSYDDLYKMYVGCIYKLNQSYTPTIAFLLKNTTCGISYDVYTNNITSSNIKMSAFELTYSRKIGVTKMRYRENKPGRMKTLFD
jgi:hypothetical protein